MARQPSVLLLLFPVLVVSACAPVGPNYKRPAVTPPNAYRGATVSPDQAQSIADLQWFELFKEPELPALVREALDNNLDLMSAIARVEEFRGRAALAGAELRPTIGGSASTSPQAAKGTIDNAYSAGLFFNWEIDFFGRLRRSAEAARADLLASEDGSRAVMSSVATGVAQLYVTLRTLDEQRAITLRTIQAQEESLRLVQTLEKGGVASGVEVQQAVTQLATTRAVLPRIERQVVLVENQLSVFVGRAPGAVVRGSGPSDLPTAPDIPAGLPSELLERRPDIRFAENELRAAVARIGVAVASKIPVPRIGLTTSFGRISTSLDDFFQGGDKAENFFSIGPFVDIPLYDGGRGSARERIARAQAEQAALGYRSVILQSLREVADSLVTIDKVRQEIAENQTRVASSREYLRLTELRYRGGVASYLEVLDAQRQQFSAELDLSDARLTQIVAVIDLYRALGGGWSDDELAKLAERPMTAMQ
jgi:multidrug efflux system outer membrane protein